MGLLLYTFEWNW